jgi:hypothetical protein
MLGLLVAVLHSGDPLSCAQAAMAIANCALDPANADVIISQQVRPSIVCLCLHLFTDL